MINVCHVAQLLITVHLVDYIREKINFAIVHKIVINKKPIVIAMIDISILKKFKTVKVFFLFKFQNVIINV